MRIAIATVQIPFQSGGAERITGLLCDELRKRGHEAEVVTIPFKWHPAQSLLDAMLVGRMIDLTEVNGERIDLVIAMKFPAYYLRHPNKVVWLIHQHRQAYDLWGTEYGDIHRWEEGEHIRNAIVRNDTKFLKEAKRIFTISRRTAERLKTYNDIDAVPLYSPPKGADRFHCQGYGDFVFYPSRIDPVKRQSLLIEAARFLKTSVKIVIAGKGSEKESGSLRSRIAGYGLQDRVRLLGFVSEEEKIELYSRCLGVYFGAYDEDYGYVPLEAFFSRKPVIVHTDSGGPLEFVTDGENGHVVDPHPEAIAARIDGWTSRKGLAERMGRCAYQTIIDKGIHWGPVIDALLGKGKGRDE